MFEIPQLVFDTYNFAMDAMIDVNFGIPCRLYYPPEAIDCTNCLIDYLNGKSSNVYNGTGPIPFQDTFCPYCNGEGSTPNIVTADIKLRCYFTPKNWLKLNVDVKAPDGSMQTIGHIADLPNCRRAAWLEANTNEGNFGTYKYKMWGEPQFHGFKRSNYFICFWSRTQ